MADDFFGDLVDGAADLLDLGFNPLDVTKQQSPWFFRAIVKQVDLEGGTLDANNQTDADGNPVDPPPLGNGSCPRNSVVAKIPGAAGFDGDIICWPLFQNHVMMPIKVDEKVVIMMWPGNDFSPDFNQPAYWICKEPQSRLADDVNYTHYSTGTVIQAQTDKSAEEIVGAYQEIRDSSISPKDIGEGGSSEIYTQTLSDIHFKTEPVPHFKKRAGDLVLQGSNNTLICLGTDRESAIDDTVEPTPPPGDPPEGQPHDQSVDLTNLIKDDGQGNPVPVGAGTIDIVVGRGRADDTKAEEMDLVTGKKVRNPSVATVTEGNFKYIGDTPDKEDSALIKLSMNTSMDTDFGTVDTFAEANTDAAGVFEAVPPVNDDGKSAIVQKADAIRIIARSSVKIVVQGVTDPTAAGTDPATILITPTGQIIIDCHEFRVDAKNGVSLGGGGSNKGMQAEEPAVFGNKLIEYLKKLNSKIFAIAGLATGAGPSGPVSGSPSGPPFQPGGELDGDADKLISNSVFVGE